MQLSISVKTLLIFSSLTLLMSCGSSTKLTKTWTDPSVSGSTFKPFTKVLVLARLKDQTGNRIAEDKLVGQFKPGVAIPSYSYLQPGDTSQGAVDARLQADGFDGLLYMHLTEVEKSLNVHNDSYGGYYGYRYGMGTTTVSENQTYVVETAIFSLVNGKMLWSGTTSTFNPSSLDKMLDEIIAADKAQLLKQGLIKQ